jgi:hypothetical protein
MDLSGQTVWSLPDDRKGRAVLASIKTALQAGVCTSF